MGLYPTFAICQSFIKTYKTRAKKTLVYFWLIEKYETPSNKQVGANLSKLSSTYVYIMAIRVVEFSNGGYKIRKIYA